VTHRIITPGEPRRRPRAQALVLVLIIVATFLAVGFAVVVQVQQTAAQQQTIKVLQARVDRGAALYDKLFTSYQQLTADCKVAADCTTTTPTPDAIADQADKLPTVINGQNGQPPVSWTYTDALGFSHTCGRTDPFDASAPTYTCN
jgi:uncharacterized protein HemX